MPPPESDQQARRVHIQEAGYIDKLKAVCHHGYYFLYRRTLQRRPAEGEPYNNFWKYFVAVYLFFVVQAIVFNMAQHAIKRTLCTHATPKWLTSFSCEIHDLITYETLVADVSSWFEKLYDPVVLKQLDPGDKLTDHHTRMMLWSSLAHPLFNDLNERREQWDKMIPIAMPNVSKALSKCSLQNKEDRILY